MMIEEEDYTIDKIAKENIVNISSLALIDLLICPIDSKICSKSVLCTSCERLFCIDCSLKHNTCDDNHAHLIDSNYTICQLELNKIAIDCPLHCNGLVPFMRMRNHFAICQENTVNCPKCLSSIKNKELLEHLISKCTGTMIKCYLCYKDTSIEAFLNNHLINCNKDRESDLSVTACSDCSVPYLINKSNDDYKHVCININDDDDDDNKSIQLHLKQMNVLLELFLNENGLVNNEDSKAILEFQAHLNETLRDIEEITSESINLGNKAHFDYIRQLDLKRIKGIEDKIEEIELHEQNLIFKEATITEVAYQIKHFTHLNATFNAKEQRNLAMGNALYVNQSFKEIISKQMNSQQLNQANDIAIPKCNKSNNDISSINSKIGECQINKEECAEFISKCSICLELICNKEVSKCYNPRCNHCFCLNCFSKNRHQIRRHNQNEDSNANDLCSFFHCEQCSSKPFICIMSTVLCSVCQLRTCSNCYRTKHKTHI